MLIQAKDLIDRWRFKQWILKPATLTPSRNLVSISPLLLAWFSKLEKSEPYSTYISILNFLFIYHVKMRQFSSKITKTCFDTSTLCNLIDFLARMIDKIQYFSFSAKKVGKYRQSERKVLPQNSSLAFLEWPAGQLCWPLTQLFYRFCTKGSEKCIRKPIRLGPSFYILTLKVQYSLG